MAHEASRSLEDLSDDELRILSTDLYTVKYDAQELRLYAMAEQVKRLRQPVMDEIARRAGLKALG